MSKLTVFSVGFFALALGTAGEAHACGCFAPPDPSVPVVQAGERILFALANGEVTAHIQIQYQGDAKSFGWLLPLPSVPTLELSTDELFNALLAQTQPKYRLVQRYEGNCSFGSLRGGNVTTGEQTNKVTQDSPVDPGPPSPLVVMDSIGPYDYAVLRADNRDEMFKWLTDNRYFVPAGSEAASAPYIHSGAFFLALKLRSGGAVGDVQPVVVRYRSDLPMIPIVLTSVAAKPDMGIQVWMLGAGRAIPRNYYHTVINDTAIDWAAAGRNYNDVIIRAVGEAPTRHTFVTEYAGSSALMRQRLDRPGRFGRVDELASQPDAIAFVRYLDDHGFSLTSQLLGVLKRYVPVPTGLEAVNFYGNIAYYLGPYRSANPDRFIGYTLDYQPADITHEIVERVVRPTVAASALFDDHPYLTRLYTTLSPDDMNRDPVFSYNLGLPEVPNVHEASLTFHCGVFTFTDIASVPRTLRTADDWRIDDPQGPRTDLPASRRVEILAEEGSPVVIVDNSRQIAAALGGCAIGRESPARSPLLPLLGLAAVVARWRRPQSRRRAF